MKRSMMVAVAALAAGLFACSGDTTTQQVTSCKPSYWNSNHPLQPPCTVAVNIVVDDTANHAFLNGEIQWKGNFQYDALTRMAFRDSSWNGGNGPYAPLYDDGPWTQGGHEPEFASTTPDHKFGVTIFVPIPSAAESWEYGLVDAAFGNGWIWKGPNGTFTVPAGASTPITATGMTFPAFGTTDIRLTLDTTLLDPHFVASIQSDLGEPKVKGSGWGWNLIRMYDDGTHGDVNATDGIWTFVLSEWVGAGKPYYHTGLANPGDVDEFVFTLSSANTEYKVMGTGNSAPLVAGVGAATKASGGAWDPATIVTVTNLNTAIEVPQPQP